MSMFVAPRAEFDYPVYMINIEVGDTSNPAAAIVSLGVIAALETPQTNVPPGVTNFQTAMFAAVRSLAESYDWTTDYGAGASIQNFTVTEYTENTTDVTPA